MKTMHKTYIASNAKVKELTLKAIGVGIIFGVFFGASTTYLSLRAGLSIAASIPIAVVAITIGKRYLKTTILENNIIQTLGSGGESIASGIVFTVPGFLFLTNGRGMAYFNYTTILVLAITGGVLGVMMMIPLRSTLIVDSHRELPYPEGTACAAVLISGEKSDSMTKKAFWGLSISALYTILQKVFFLVSEVPTFFTPQSFRAYPSASISGDITPEYLGLGYIIGFRISAILVAGSVLSSLVLTPLIASIVPADMIASQLVKLSYLPSLTTVGGVGGWNPVTHQFAHFDMAIYFAYIRQMGAGAVACGGFITLFNTLPTIIRSFKMQFVKKQHIVKDRLNKDLPIVWIGLGLLLAVLSIMFIPQLSVSKSMWQEALVALLILVFGFFFVTVASRIVGLIGSSNSPVSGMVIATIMATCLIFLLIGWVGKNYEPFVLLIGGVICVAISNAGNTSQDLKTGYIVGATPRAQQIALIIGVVVASITAGGILILLDRPTPQLLAEGIHHAIGSSLYPAPQGTLMATLIKGVLSFNLDWSFVLVGAMIAFVMELCGVNALNFAIGLYLPFSTTTPIFVGGLIQRIVAWRTKKKSADSSVSTTNEELSSGSLFSTGLVAGGSIMGVLVVILYSSFPSVAHILTKVDASPFFIRLLSIRGYDLMGVVFFILLSFILFRIALRKDI